MKSYEQTHLQLSNLQYDEIPLKRCEKRAKKQRFCQRFNNDSAGGASAGAPILGLDGLPRA